MEKKLFLIVSLFIMIMMYSVCIAYADNTCVFGPDIKEDNQLIRTCWFYDEAGKKIIDPVSGFAGRTEIYEHLLDIEDRYEQVMEIYLDPEENLMNGPYGYAKMTTVYDLYASGPVCRYWYTSEDPENNICGYTHRYFDADEKPVLVRNEDGFEGFRDNNSIKKSI